MFNPGSNIYPNWNRRIKLFYFSFIIILLDICQRGRQWYVLNRYKSGIDYQYLHFSDVLIFTSSFFALIIFKSNDRVFVNVKLIDLSWKFNIINYLISVFFFWIFSMSFVFIILLLHVFVNLNIFFTVWSLCMGIFWSFIMRFSSMRFSSLSWINWIFSQWITFNC